MCTVVRATINRNNIEGMKKIEMLDTSIIIPDTVIPTAEYVGIPFFLY